MTKIAPFVIFIFSVFVAAFLGGTLTAHFDVFPYPNIRDAGRTLKALIERETTEQVYFGAHIEPTAFPASDAANRRWRILDKSAPRLPVIAFGGLNQYLELCPDLGCLAVTFDAEGTVTETWPYRPVDIYAADITGGAYSHELLAFDPIMNAVPIGVNRYADGDILVNFQSRGSIFPFGMGVARIGQDGTPRWTRFDFSHHWSDLTADGIAYVPSLTVGGRSLNFDFGTEPSPRRFMLKCDTDRPQLDIVQLIDASGGVVEEIELVPIFLESNWAGLLPETTDFCDPLHLNYIDEIGADAGPGLSAGDLVVSLRNISRFVVLDRVTREIKRVVSGGFIQQHSVRHLSGLKFLIFDNQGGDLQGPASRIVELDLATGVERRLFPNASTPEPYAPVYSATFGHLDISPDRSRILASFSDAGRAFEVDVASGRLLAVYDNVHDISSIREVPKDERERAGRFSIFGMSYLKE